MKSEERVDHKFEYCVRDHLRCMHLEQRHILTDEIDVTSDNESFFKKISTRLFKK